MCQMKKRKTSEWMGKNWKKLLLFVMAHVAVLYVAFGFYSDDYYRREIKLSDFTAQSDQDASVEAAIDSDAYFSLNLSGSHPTDLESSQMTVPTGYYMVYVQYETEQDCSLESYSSTYLNQDNSLGNTFGGMLLPADHTTAEGPIWVDQDARDFIFRFHYNGGRTTVYNITLKSMKPYPDVWWYCGIAFMVEVILAFIYIRSKKKNLMRNFGLCIYILIIALLVSIPLMNDFGYDNGDIAFHIDRIEGISYYLTHFSWNQPVMRINEVSGNGGGYAAPIFYPQIFLFIPGFLHACGCSMLMSYKIYIFMINLTTAGLSLISFRGLSKHWGVGIIGCAAYTMAIYRMTDIYYRAAVGEYTAMAFLPLFFWALYEVICRDYKKWIYLAISMIGILSSHILTTAVCGCFAIIMVLVNIIHLLKNPIRIGALLKSVIVAVLLNAWFLIPFLRSSTLPLEIFVDPDKQSNVSETVAYFSQMFNTHVFDLGVSQNVGSTNGEMPISVGLLLLVSAILYIVLRYIPCHCANIIHKGGDHMCLVGAVISIWMASNLFPWKQAQMLMPDISRIQFSWRMLAFATVFLSYIFGCLGYSIYELIQQRLHQEQEQKIALLLILIVTVSLPLAEIHPYIDSLQDAPYVSREDMELMGEPDALYSYPKTNNDLKNIVLSDSSEVTLSSVFRSGTQMSFQMDVTQQNPEFLVELPVNYMQGYQLFSENQRVMIQNGVDGKIMFRPEAGKKQYRLYFQEWRSWKVADGVSVCSVALFLAIWLRKIRKG